jgi:hypothetical protein
MMGILPDFQPQKAIHPVYACIKLWASFSEEGGKNSISVVLKNNG